MIKPLLVMIAVGAVVGLLSPDAEKPARQAVVAGAQPVDEAPRETILEKKANGHFYVDAEVNGQLVNFVVDTGASFVALTVDDARRIGIPFSQGAFTVVAQGASGPVRGEVLKLGSVSLDGKSVTDVNGAVLEGLPVSLLGQSYLSRISSVQMAGDHMTLR